MTEANGTGTATITVTANDGNGGTIEDDFILTVNASEPFSVFGYRVRALIPNGSESDPSNIILQVSEGDIFFGNNTIDLFSEVMPTGSTPILETSLAKFNNGLDDQSISGIYHSRQDSEVKMIQVLGTVPLTATSGTIRIRIVGRNQFQSRSNGYVVTLLDANGNPIGIQSDLSSGFEDENEAHDGFVVDFDAATGVVTRQPTIFSL